MTERKLFYVDVGDMSAKEAEQYMNNITSKMNGKKYEPIGFWGIFFSFFTFNW